MIKNINIRGIFTLKGLYYISTLIIAILVGFVSGTVDILHTAPVLEASKHLGYPLYFFSLLGVFKILGGIILLLPRFFNKYKSAAYWGFAFDFIFASFSHYSVGDDTTKIAAPLVFLLFLAISYFLKDRV